MNKSINGFNPDEIFLLYAFVEAYETAGIKSFDHQNTLFDEHPELRELLNVLSLVKCNTSSSEGMKLVDFKSLRNEIFFTLYGGCNLLSFLYHVRNSIAHACAVKHENSVLITDFKVKQPTDFSARGRIELRVINKFTKILEKVVL